MTEAIPTLPNLSRIRRSEPRQLRKKIKELALDSDIYYALETPNRDLLSQAIAKLEEAFETASAANLGRKDIRVLIRGFGELEEGHYRRAVAHFACRMRVGWRYLWLLWQQGGHDDRERGRIVEALTSELLGKRKASRRFRELRFPKWLPTERSALVETLGSPGESVKRYVEDEAIGLPQVDRETSLSLLSPLGHEVLCELIRKGSDDWWTVTEDVDELAWAADQDLDVKQLFAERSLRTVGQGATCPADLPDSHLLLNWVEKNLGDPLRNPGRWTRVSPRAIEIYEWFFSLRAFHEILREFDFHAEKERASFWKTFERKLTDARYVEGTSTPICLMVFGRVLVVEFGHTGNACYLYEAPPPEIRLRSLESPTRPYPGWFKDTNLLDLGQMRLVFHTRLVHRENWQPNFRRELARRYGLTPGRSR